MELENYFQKFRNNTIGIDTTFESPFGEKKIVYTDWTASGRLYRPIEEKISNDFGPFVANTHTETNITGCLMTMAYHKAKDGIKEFVNASKHDVLISEGSGMTGVMIKLQRILGFKIDERFRSQIEISAENTPVVFVTHMEHHSNQTSWYETIATVEIIDPINAGEVDLEHLKRLLEKYKNRTIKIASVTAASNVTGIKTDYHAIAKIMHQNNGLCFVDFACSAPYVNINMHPTDPLEKLDAITFSPHKFLGGPGTTGILIFCPTLYHSKIPDNPGGGTVDWTNPWGGHKYVDDIESREDGGTPAFLQTIKVYLAMKLKEEMGVENILKREEEIAEKMWKGFEEIPNLHVLANEHKNRLGIYSFVIEGAHYNLIVKLLSDHYGIQVRGGCSCAGTYGHYLLNVNEELSNQMTSKISAGDNSNKLGWVRLSIHPIIKDSEIDYIIESLKFVAKNYQEMAKEYIYMPKSNDFQYALEYTYDTQKLGELFA